MNRTHALAFAIGAGIALVPVAWYIKKVMDAWDSAWGYG